MNMKKAHGRIIRTPMCDQDERVAIVVDAETGDDVHIHLSSNADWARVDGERGAALKGYEVEWKEVQE